MLELLKGFLRFIDADMIEPTLYGWFHIMWLAIVLIASIITIVFRKKLSNKKTNIILTVLLIAMIILEILKQINFSYDVEKDIWEYEWYSFPFQFCSTPMYVLSLALIFQKTKFAKACNVYLGTYGLFAGIGVMLYPSTVFIDTILINNQTMVHHGGMIYIAVLLWVSKKEDFNLLNFLNAIKIFISLVIIAMIMNKMATPEMNFNMFWIAQNSECPIPVLSSVYATVSYPLFIVTYILGFSLLAGIMMLLAKGISKLINTKNKAITE